MKKKRNVTYVVQNNLCLNCGICAGACPTNCITIEQKRNQFIPIVNPDLCISNKGCTRCLDICPGKGINLNKIASSLFIDENTKNHPLVGRYQNCYTGYSTDKNLRFHSASGRSLSQFLIWLLENKKINGAVVTKFDASKEYLVETFIAKTKDEIFSAKSSKYCNHSVNREEENLLFAFINSIYESTSFIITSNKSPAEWARSLDDEVPSTVLLDRLLYKCELFAAVRRIIQSERNQTNDG